MAKNLHKTGYPLMGYDIDSAKCKVLAATGATAGKNMEDVDKGIGRGIALSRIENLGHFNLQ